MCSQGKQIGLLGNTYVCLILQVSKSRELFTRFKNPEIMVNLLEQNIKCEKNEQQRFVKLQINLCLYSFDVKAHMWWPSSRLHLSGVTIHLVVSLSSNFSILTCNGMCMLVINHICIRWYNLIHIFSYVCILTMGSNTPHWSFQMSSRCWTGLVKYWNFNSKSKQIFLVVAGEHKPPPPLKKT